MPFKPGQSGNPKGRRPKIKKKILLSVTVGGGPVDELDLLSAIVSHPEIDPHTRMQAAGLLAPYRHGKMTRFVEEPVDVPVSATVEEATAAIAQISALARAKRISLETANDLISQEKSFIEAKVGLDIEGQMLELRQIVEKLSASARPVDAVVIGGLPRLPGTAIDMPALNRPANGGEGEDGS